jgi:hypothetical protein
LECDYSAVTLEHRREHRRPGEPGPYSGDAEVHSITDAATVFLPWIAVVIANGSDKAEIHSDSLLDFAPYAEIDASPPTEQAAEQEPDVLQGELLEDNGDTGEDVEGEERTAS